MHRDACVDKIINCFSSTRNTAYCANPLFPMHLPFAKLFISYIVLYEILSVELLMCVPYANGIHMHKCK